MEHVHYEESGPIKGKLCDPQNIAATTDGEYVFIPQLYRYALQP
jgi:hypothetical protein